MVLQLVGFQSWAQLGSNQRPPDYEYSFFNLLFGPKMRRYFSYLEH